MDNAAFSDQVNDLIATFRSCKLTLPKSPQVYHPATEARPVESNNPNIKQLASAIGMNSRLLELTLDSLPQRSTDPMVVELIKELVFRIRLSYPEIDVRYQTEIAKSEQAFRARQEAYASYLKRKEKEKATIKQKFSRLREQMAFLNDIFVEALAKPVSERNKFESLIHFHLDGFIFNITNPKSWKHKSVYQPDSHVDLSIIDQCTETDLIHLLGRLKTIGFMISEATNNSQSS